MHGGELLGVLDPRRERRRDEVRGHEAVDRLGPAAGGEQPAAHAAAVVEVLAQPLLRKIAPEVAIVAGDVKRHRRRGPGKQFKLSLLTDDGFDSLNYQASFAPKGTDWQTLRLPLADFRYDLVPEIVAGGSGQADVIEIDCGPSPTLLDDADGERLVGGNSRAGRP